MLFEGYIQKSSFLQAVRPDRVLEELRRSSGLMNGESLEEDLQIAEPPPTRGESAHTVRSRPFNF